MSDFDNTASSPFGRGWIPAARALGLSDDPAFLHHPADGHAITPDRPAGPPCGAANLPAHVPAPRRDGFSPERQAAFLAALATGGSVRGACARVGITAQTAYVCRRRSAHFAAGWDAALVLARDHAEQVLADRAFDGVEEAVFYHGEQVAVRRRFDARLLLAHLARLDRHCAADPASRRRAARFDELLATLSGEQPQGIDPQDWRRDADPHLPPTRDDHVAVRTEGLGPRAFSRARARAEEEWDRWQVAARARVDTLSETPPPPSGPSEFKSLHRPGRISAPDPVTHVNFASEPVMRPHVTPPSGTPAAAQERVMHYPKAFAAAALIASAALTTAASAAPTKATGVMLMATLSGSAEVPGPGDTDGTGSFHGRLNVGQGQLCYTLTSSMIGTRTAAHIHTGKAGAAGPPVVTLVTNAPTETCVAVDKETAQNLVSKPADFYVNVHTSDFPNGAVRGQLMKH